MFMPELSLETTGDFSVIDLFSAWIATAPPSRQTSTASGDLACSRLALIDDDAVEKS